MNKFSPSHYQRGKIEVWDFIADQELDFFAGNVIKYVCRAGHKDQEGELDDLKKAKVYIDKKIALYNDRTRKLINDLEQGLEPPQPQKTLWRSGRQIGRAHV